jgi:plasmid stabilization system protein ParE
MHKVLFSLKASEEYVDIKNYIAKDNLFYAYDVLIKIDASIDTISQFPFIGKIVS